MKRLPKLSLLLSLWIALPFVAAMPASAAEVSLLSGGAVEPGIVAFAALVKRELGHELKIQFNTAPQIAKRLAAGETWDILVSPPAVIDAAQKDGKILADGRTQVGRVGVGIVVREALPAPVIGSAEALKDALMRADSVVYNSASTGLYLDRLFAQLGLSDALRPKTTRYPDGASVMEHVIHGKGQEIGFGAITEIGLYTSKGLRYVGPLPAETQNYTRYDAAIMTGARQDSAAADVLKLLATPAARAAFTAAGID